jgi:hypothetical protein
MIDREVTVCSRGDCADASFGLFEPALALGVDEPPAVFDEFAPSVALGERDGELGFKLFVNRFVVEDNCVSVLVWLARGVDERMDRGGHPAGHHPGCSGGLSSWVGDQDRSGGHHADAKDGSGWLTSVN